MLVLLFVGVYCLCSLFVDGWFCIAVCLLVALRLRDMRLSIDTKSLRVDIGYWLLVCVFVCCLLCYL